MNTIWQMWSGGVDNETVSKIITECEYYSPSEGSIGYSGDTQNNNYRNSELRWIDKQDPNSKFIADLIWSYGHQANREAFGFNIDYLKDIQYTIYRGEENGKYDWHHDTFWGNPSTYDRKVTVVMQLSDPSEYEGGEFEFDNQYPQPNPLDFRKKGTVICFPSFIPHKVNEVTKGVRKTLVGWIEGPKFR